jgi:hypothetical protein
MSDETRKEAYTKIEIILKQIGELYLQAEEIAKEGGVSFDTNGPAYGMGGCYTPPEHDDASDYGGWMSSSCGY